jgi:hypothetical protein
VIWYPSKPQWIVIWVAVLIGFFVLAEFDQTGALFVFAIGGLLVWLLNKPKVQNATSAPREPPQPERTKGPYCVNCGIGMEPSWNVCPECGQKSVRAEKRIP